MSALRILVADDHEVVRRGLCVLLKSHAGWEVCAEAADGREAVEKAKLLKPDVVILDIGFGHRNAKPEWPDRSTSDTAGPPPAEDPNSYYH